MFCCIPRFIVRQSACDDECIRQIQLLQLSLCLVAMYVFSTHFSDESEVCPVQRTCDTQLCIVVFAVLSDNFGQHACIDEVYCITGAKMVRFAVSSSISIFGKSLHCILGVLFQVVDVKSPLIVGCQECVCFQLLSIGGNITEAAGCHRVAAVVRDST